MIGQSPTLSAIAKENLEEARMQLIDAIANYNAVISDEISFSLVKIVLTP
jgi:predicted RNA-binding protein with PIN domain